MSVQIIQDGKGRPTGVFIPMSQWKQLKKQYKNLELLEDNIDRASEGILDNIKAGLKEVALYKKGELKTTSAKDFLDEL